MTGSLVSKIKAAAWTTVAVVSLTFGYVALAQESPGPSASGGLSEKIAAEDVESCMACHSTDVSMTIRKVDAKKFKASPHADMTCQDCHSSVDGAPHTATMIKEDTVSCADCHSDVADLYAQSAHAKPDKEGFEGDHPTCYTCHGDGDPHAIKMMKPSKAWTKQEEAAMCSKCHSDTERMARYNVDTDAVPSYEESFHGKALLRFNNQATATCVDCHGSHVMLSPTEPMSNVARDNVSKVCSKPECHPGAQGNFAVSGANHVRLKMKQVPILNGIYIFFRVLTFGMIAFMLAGVGLDLRTKVFGPHEPRSGRFIGTMIAVAYILVIAALGVGMFGMSELASTLAVSSAALLISGYVFYFARRKKPEPVADGQPVYQRFTLSQRLQHVALMVSFTILIMTGLPMRFYNVVWLEKLYIPFGGFAGARYAHRVAAILLIITFLWHTIGLFIKWAKMGFPLKALTMVPNKKDAHDFVQLMKSYTDPNHEHPKFDRFQFKQKMDYMAEYWGVPLMVVTGFILWFPVYWAHLLPESSISVAWVAHSWEATLAFIAIITWHIYNEHFNPDAFPMSKVWLTGKLTHEEMLREHPLELERIQAAETATTFEAEVVEPASEATPDDAPAVETDGEDVNKPNE